MVNHIDDSRERPESAVSGSSDDTGGTGNPIADTAIKAATTVKQNPRRDDDEEDTERQETQRQDTRADDSRERPESAVSDDRNSQDFTGR